MAEIFLLHSGEDTLKRRTPRQMGRSETEAFCLFPDSRGHQCDSGVPFFVTLVLNDDSSTRAVITLETEKPLTRLL